MWKLSTVEKKSCTEIEFWTRDGLTAQRELGWRSCSVTYDEKPNIDNYDPNNFQIELTSLGDIVDANQDDGCWSSWTWPE